MTPTNTYMYVRVGLAGEKYDIIMTLLRHYYDIIMTFL